MSTIYILEQVNLFCGDEDTQNGKFLTLTNLQLPGLEEATSDQMGGGAIAGVAWGMGVMNALEAGFNLAGYDPQVLSLFGLGSGKRQNFTAYGVIKDKRTSEEIEAKAVIEAILGVVTPDEFERGELQGYEYGLREIVHYESYFDGREKHWFDLWTNQWRVDGVSKKQNSNRILRIPGA